jgi:hypothetical protein
MAVDSGSQQRQRQQQLRMVMALAAVAAVDCGGSGSGSNRVEFGGLKIRKRAKLLIEQAIRGCAVLAVLHSMYDMD